MHILHIVYSILSHKSYQPITTILRNTSIFLTDAVIPYFFRVSVSARHAEPNTPSSRSVTLAVELAASVTNPPEMCYCAGLSRRARLTLRSEETQNVLRRVAPDAKIRLRLSLEGRHSDGSAFTWSKPTRSREGLGRIITLRSCAASVVRVGSGRQARAWVGSGRVRVEFNARPDPGIKVGSGSGRVWVATRVAHGIN
ncbi:hypothetical protein R3P38DRAFT_2768457 [Favolaschia claudopus]|uniref:Uncharacterized protein n=1 Tax=Favolaschia claudopus TaxID=2862362 RepID=A0AAW0CS04_9AGAR